MTITNDNRLLTLKEAAEWLQVPASWIYQRTHAGASERIPFIKLGRLLRFDRAELQHWLDDRRRGSISTFGSATQ
jgi:excisionase family DNA binding protein